MAARGTIPGLPPLPPSDLTPATDVKPPHLPSPPPAPASPAGNDAPPKNQEELGFQHSPYYKIRAAISNLRGRFIQVCQATDPQKKEAALEIRKELKVLMELSKKTRLDISAPAEPVEPLDVPAIRFSYHDPAGNISSREKNQAPRMGPAATFLHNPVERVPVDPVCLSTYAMRQPVEIQREAKPSEITNQTNQLGERVQGSYVVGGSPIGWNFLMWPGSKAVYYGLTREEWLARQAA